MKSQDTLSLEILGVKASATGSFAIIAVLLAVMIGGAVYLMGRKNGIW
jgi:hypothetical protein